MYAVLVGLHNLLRWVVLVMAVVVLVRSYRGWLSQREWTDRDRKWGVFFTSAMDTQLLLGLLLYFFFSNWALKAVIEKGMSFVMGQDIYRFFVVEHVFYMILAVIFAHLGSILPRKVNEAVKKHQRAAIFFSLAVLVILLGMPWFRPLFPG